MYRHGLGLLIILILCVSPAVAAPFVFDDRWLELPADEVVMGGTLSLHAVGDPRTFNPLVSQETNIVVDLMAGSWYGAAALAWWPPGALTPVPRAAESIERSDDGLVFDVVLRQDMRWSDGSPITLADYLIAHELESNPDTGGYRAPAWTVDGEPITVEATGPWSLRITLPGPDREALDRLSLTPLPDRVFGEAFRTAGAEAVNALWGVESNPDELLFSGAYRLASYVAGERLVFERNPHFGEWNVDALGRPLPYLDGVTYSVVSAETALNLFVAGELDEYTPNDLDEVGVIQGSVARGDLDAIVREAIFPTTGYTFIAFNWNLASDPAKERLFRDVRFRRAMGHLVDREAIVELAYGGSGFPLYGSVHPTLDAWLAPDLDVPTYEPERALALLAELGFERRGADGILVDDAGRRLSFRLVTNAENAQREQILQIFADTAREVGVEVVTASFAFSLLVDQLLAEGDDRPFEAVLIGLTGDRPPWPFDLSVFLCSGSLHLWNKSGACLDDVEARIEELTLLGRRTLDDDAAREIALELQRLEAEQQSVVYVAGPAFHHAASPALQGYFRADLIGPFDGLYLPVLVWRR